MGFQSFVISTVESFFPTGSKRRDRINIIGKPIVRLLGFPMPEVMESSVATATSQNGVIDTAKKLDNGTGTYWESIRNFIHLKLELFLTDHTSVLEFPEFETPVVSILIITYNKAEYTYQCLETIKAHSDVPYEVIIVDNASTDSTPFLLDKVGNSTIIRNSENVGFLLACNHGAKKARGQYILFLNNDTQAPAGWLSTLVNTMKRVPKCGAVGAKLVLPDGSMQEAGSIIWSDGSALGYGRGGNPLDPDYNFLREVHYCSGACLMVRADLFETLGGFDTRFVPAYYEESDLCMGIANLGYKVVYQPLVNIIHYEFGSGKRDKAVELQVANRKKFVEKWQSTLDTFYASDKKNVLKARGAGKSLGRVLFIEDRVPDPSLGAGYPRAFRLLSDLVALGYEVTFFPLLVQERPVKVTSHFQQLGVEVLYGGAGRKINFNDFFTKRADYYDVAFVSRPHNMNEVVDVLRTDSNLKIVYDAEAIFALREIIQLELKGKSVDKKTKASMIRIEIELTSGADSVVTVSESEKKIFEEHGVQNVFVAGHVMDVKPTPNSFEARKDLLFVGNLAPSSPNEDSVLYFVKEVFPSILKNIDCKLHIVGPNATDTIRSLASEQVIVAGLVDDLYSYYNSCRIFLAPTRYAAGIPFKVHEASSYGIPSVVTPLIAEQLNWKDSNQVLIGSNAQKYAEQVVMLYNDEVLWNKVRDSSIKAVKEDCAATKFKSNLASSLESVLS